RLPRRSTRSISVHRKGSGGTSSAWRGRLTISGRCSSGNGRPLIGQQRSPTVVEARSTVLAIPPAMAIHGPALVLLLDRQNGGEEHPRCRQVVQRGAGIRVQEVNRRGYRRERRDDHVAGLGVHARPLC